MRIQRGKFYFTVQWERRADGVQPQDGVFTNTELKSQVPSKREDTEKTYSVDELRTEMFRKMVFRNVIQCFL